MPRLSRLQLVDDLHRPHFWRARHRARREPRHHRIDHVVFFRVETARHVGDDVHDVAVALDEKLVGHLHRADFGDPADIVAAEVKQHQVLGALLAVGQQFGFERAVLVAGLSARASAGDRPDGDLAIAHPHQDLRRRADHRELGKIEVEQERRGVDAAQRAIERERRQRRTGRKNAVTAPPGKCRRRRCTPWPCAPCPCRRRARCWRFSSTAHSRSRQPAPAHGQAGFRAPPPPAPAARWRLHRPRGPVPPCAGTPR